jgi:hypothetical protein
LEIEAMRNNALDYLTFLVGPDVQTLLNGLVLSEFPTINKTERKDGEELEH